MKIRTASDFTLLDQEGKVFNLFENLDKNNVLLVFYPKDNSPVCSRQLKNYSNTLTNFADAGIIIAAINNASVKEHLFFCQNKDLNMRILSDPEMKVIKDYDALYPLNFIKRKLVFINTDKKVVFEKNLPPYSYWSNDQILEYLAQNQLIL